FIYTEHAPSHIYAPSLHDALPISVKGLTQYLKEDRKAVIFPEGRITVTGALMKVYDGAGLIAEKSGATVLPIRIDGTQYTLFSRDRKSTRLNSSHVKISYAVFCLK